MCTFRIGKGIGVEMKKKGFFIFIFSGEGRGDACELENMPEPLTSWMPGGLQHV